MLRLVPMNRFRIKCSNIGYFSSKKMSDKPQNISVKDATTSSDDAASFVHRRSKAPSNFERTLLVWTKMYKSKEEIPKKLPVEAVDKARNKARIKLANYMMIATLIACVFVSIRGKRAAERGESVEKMNLAWHKKYREEAALAEKK